eukprot:11121738-Alexandrium_andersonii.AAC.1
MAVVATPPNRETLTKWLHGTASVLRTAPDHIINTWKNAVADEGHALRAAGIKHRGRKLAEVAQPFRRCANSNCHAANAVSAAAGLHGPA